MSSLRGSPPPGVPLSTGLWPRGRPTALRLEAGPVSLLQRNPALRGSLPRGGDRAECFNSRETRPGWGAGAQLRQLTEQPSRLAAPQAGGHSRPRAGRYPSVEVGAATHPRRPSSWSHSRRCRERQEEGADGGTDRLWRLWGSRVGVQPEPGRDLVGGGQSWDLEGGAGGSHALCSGEARPGGWRHPPCPLSSRL